MSVPQIGVVIPTFMAGLTLEETIQSVRAAQSSARIKVTIVVVDNHPESVDRQYSNSADHYIALVHNPGFGGACNSGISYLFNNSNTELFFLLNPDATIEKSFFLELKKYIESNTCLESNPIMPLISFEFLVQEIDCNSIFKNPGDVLKVIDLEDNFQVFNEIGMPLTQFSGGSKTLAINDHLVIRPEGRIPSEINYMINEENKVQFFEITPEVTSIDRIVQNAGSTLSSPFSAGDSNTGWLTKPSASYLNGPRQAWCGAAVILPRQYFITVGGFDETFFLYYEDTEFSLRGIKKGIFPKLATGLRVSHKHSGITGQFPKLREREIWKSRIIFSCRTVGYIPTFLFICLRVARFILMLISRRTTLRHFLRFLLPEIIFSLRGFVVSFRIRSRAKHLDIS